MENKIGKFFFVFWFKLLKLFLKRNRGEKEYFEFQQYQAQNLIDNIKNVLNLDNLDNEMKVYDYGCGSGGYSLILAENFRDVLAVDFYSNPKKDKFLDIKNIQFENADLNNYNGGERDFLFCASVIEHISKDKQNDFIANLRNNIKDGGSLYLSFPPFYSLNGGHCAAPFHYLPNKLAFFLTKKIRKFNIVSYENMFETWGLYKTSIQEIEKMLKGNGFEIIKIGSRYMPEWFVKIFGKNNFLNWHVEFFCKK